ncbi:MAG: DinB family protein [Candidatus Thorarchaeota archaeon]|jgi:uncharacterized damage-inducible protein DinB
MKLLEKIGRYLIWADETIWKLVEGLTEEEFSRVFSESGRSIRQRYVHLAGDIWEWYHDWIGETPSTGPDFEGMNRRELYEYIYDYNQRIIGMVENRDVNQFELDMKDKKIEVVFDEFLFHIANHATYHRGQIVMSLRMLGKDVPMTDYIPHRIATA